MVSLLFLNVQWAEKRLDESNERFRAWIEQKEREILEQQQHADSK